MSGRPEILFPLFGDLSGLKGIGPKTAETLGHMGVEVPRDLLFTLPHSIVDRRLRDTVQGVWVTGLPDAADVITVGQEYVIEGVEVAPSFQEPM